MSRFLRSVLVAVAIMIVTAALASATPDEDFVVGNGVIVVDTPFGPLPIEVSIDAHSGASGEAPRGSVTFTLQSRILVGGPVTCLAVTGNTATIGFDDAILGHVSVDVVDNSSTGSPDTVADPFGPADCSPGTGLPQHPLAGDLVVHDVLPLTSKDQCKEGGWRDFTDDEGHPFKNQGECVAFVEHAA